MEVEARRGRRRKSGKRGTCEVARCGGERERERERLGEVGSWRPKREAGDLCRGSAPPGPRPKGGGTGPTWRRGAASDQRP